MTAAPEEIDVYTHTADDDYPFARQRSRPGSDPRDQVYERVQDSSGRYVSMKPANKAFLSSQVKREAHQRRVEADKLERERRRATGSGSSISSTQILLFILFLPLLSSFLTGSYTFNLSPYIVPPVRRYIRETPLNPFRKPLKVFTPDKLRRYDGSDPWLPVYLAIDGDVYDVSKNKRVYGKGGSYNMMTGRDASRSFVTGCFQTHLTHDLRGLSLDQLKSLDHWKSFFANHNDYRRIGRILNPDIDPSSPIPPPCHDENTEADLSAKGQAAAHHAPVRAGPARKHEEL